MKKKVFIVFLALVLLLAAAGAAGKLIYNSVDESKIPDVSVSVFGAALEPVKCDWHEAVFKGLAYKEFSIEDNSAALDVGELADVAAQPGAPEGYDASYELFLDDELISTGDVDQFGSELYGNPGSYKLLIYLEKPYVNHKTYGSFSFSVDFTVPPPDPELVTGRLSLSQGEIFVMELTNVPRDTFPAAVTDLGMAVFTPKGEGEWFAAIPVGNTRAPGTYKVKVSAGERAEHVWAIEVSVKAYSFDTQNLIIDTSNPVISEANSPEAYAQYRAKIPPLFDTYDSELYWEGTFIPPVSGRISTEFGSIRYTNSNWASPRYHWGVDIATDRGTPVKAPNNGRVVFAEYLLNTGNTVVIEHGGGFKSYYFHMDSLNVNAGDMVQKGDQIGTVGSTGYSTGPHLHFETRIGDQAVNPLMLYDSSASLYDIDIE